MTIETPKQTVWIAFYCEYADSFVAGVGATEEAVIEYIKSQQAPDPERFWEYENGNLQFAKPTIGLDDFLWEITEHEVIGQ